MLVSFLLPTRTSETNTEWQDLINALQSIIELSSKKFDWEVLIAIDNDDTETLAKIPTIEKIFEPHTFCNCRIEIMERQGYNNLEKYYNYLGELAKGEFLFFWNDDVIMVTPNWDEILKEDFTLFPEMICLFPLEYNYATPHFKTHKFLLHHAFPIIRNCWISVLGQISKFFMNDTYVMNVSLGSFDYSRLVVSHHNIPQTDNENYYHSIALSQKRENEILKSQRWTDEIVKDNLLMQKYLWERNNAQDKFVYNNVFHLHEEKDLLGLGIVSEQRAGITNIETPPLVNYFCSKHGEQKGHFFYNQIKNMPISEIDIEALELGYWM